MAITIETRVNEFKQEAREKAPNPRLHSPEKFQTSGTELTTVTRCVFGVWFLELLWSLDLGVWSFLQ